MTLPLTLANDPPPPPADPPRQPPRTDPPPDNRPPNKPPRRAELLETPDLLLRSIEMLVNREYPAAFPGHASLVGEFRHSLMFTRSALRDLGDASQTPARRTSLNDEGRGPSGGPVPNSGRAEEPRPDGGVPGDRHLPAVAGDVPACRARDEGRAGGAVGAATQTCGHCLKPARGYATQQGIRLCHPDEGLDCYRLVTVYEHGMPCGPCSTAPGAPVLVVASFDNGPHSPRQS